MLRVFKIEVKIFMEGDSANGFAHRLLLLSAMLRLLSFVNTL